MAVALHFMLVWSPAPLFGRMSLRSRASNLLLPPRGPERRRYRWRQARRHTWKLRFCGYIGVFLLLWLPCWQPQWGPLSSPAESRLYLGTLWQVVAAALGVSVAMVAFAFEAFSGSRERRAYGGSLREFAYESWLVLAIEVGLLSLALDGVVLFGPFGLETKGWPALEAVFLSGVTLLAVVLVVHRILRLLDERALSRMRVQRSQQLAEDAMREQLVGQAAEVWLGSAGLPLKRDLLGGSGYTIAADASGVVENIHLGKLLRWQRKSGRNHPPAQLWLRVSVNGSVDDQDQLLVSSQQPTERAARRLRCAFQITEPLREPADRELLLVLERLHGDAMEAARAGLVREWREVSAIYERIILTTVGAAAQFGLRYEGAIMSPGFFGQGPVHRVRDFLYDELVAAVENNHRELVGPISYFPQHIAAKAAEAGAPAVAIPLMALYPAMYRLARES